MHKIYVDVLASWTREGKIVPRVIKWIDGQRYPIDKVEAVRTAVAPRVRGIGTEYTILVHGKQKTLFLEQDRWFVESKYPQPAPSYSGAQ